MTPDDERPNPDRDSAPMPADAGSGGNRTGLSRGRDRTDREQDLRATTDSIQADVDRLSAIEAEKQELDPHDPRIDELSDVAVTVADRIAHETRAERQLGRELG